MRRRGEIKAYAQYPHSSGSSRTKRCRKLAKSHVSRGLPTEALLTKPRYDETPEKILRGRKGDKNGIRCFSLPILPGRGGKW